MIFSNLNMSITDAMVIQCGYPHSYSMTNLIKQKEFELRKIVGLQYSSHDIFGKRKEIDTDQLKQIYGQKLPYWLILTFL